MNASPRSQGRMPLIALLIGGALIGGSPIFVRLSEIGPISTAFWRLSLALIPLLVVSARGQASQADVPRTVRDIVMVCIPGLFLAADLATWHLALHLTSVANASLLANLAPIFVTLYSWIVLRQKPRTLFLVALAITVTGIVVLKGGPAALGAGNLKGDLIATLAAVFYGGYILALSKMRERFATSAIMIWSTLAGALSVLPFAWLSEPTLVPVTVTGWMVLFGLSWISQAAGQSLIAYALAWLPATFSSLTLLLQPVVAAILAWLVLEEQLTVLQGIGGAIALTGVWISRMAQR